MSEDQIGRIARETRTIAVVGLSPKADRPSFSVARYLQSAGFRIIPVNPGHAGELILGEVCQQDLSAIPDSGTVDMVDIFRRPEAVPQIVDEALASLPSLRVIWMQIGVAHAAAAAKARDAGITVIENRCPKIDFPRYL
ncbi:CoA-binding protein [Paracoccus suum]|nr:CoA-binding protein [Paracoccus suum]